VTVDLAPKLLLGDLAVGDELPELAVEVTATTVVLGALATRDWRPMHHDYKFATERNGTKDIFLNTPNQAAWFERYLTDWTGPHGRIGKVTFRMRDSVFPGDTMVFRGVVTEVSTDDAGCGWVAVDVALTVAGDDGADRTMTTGAARIAVPVDADDNPWARGPETWRP
jgi:acyl dehydratase